MADEASDNVKPWTIRGIPPEERNAASQAAKRSDMTLGDWLIRAIRTQIQQENQSSRAPVPVGPVVSDKLDNRPSLSDMERIADKLTALVVAGAPVAKKHLDKLTAALVADLTPPIQSSAPSARGKGKGKSDGSQTPPADLSDKLAPESDNQSAGSQTTPADLMGKPARKAEVQAV